MSSQRVLVFTSAILWVLFTMFGKNWAKSAIGYAIGNRFRLIAVLRIECIITALNVLCHDQLLQYFDEDIVKEKSFERRRLQVLRGRCSTGLIIFLFLGQSLYFIYYAPEFLQWLIFDLTSICSGIWTNLIAFVCGFYLVNVIVRLMTRNKITVWLLDVLGTVPFFYDMMWNRKRQIRFTILITLILSISMYISSDWIVVKQRTIEIKNFTASQKNLRVAVVSDLHAGASVYKQQIYKVVDKIMENKVDAILIVGDMVDGSVAELQDRVLPITKLPGHAPTFFVSGNHEYYYGNAIEWFEFYRKAGINVLDNDSVMMKGVCLAGVNDISSPKSGIPNHKMDIVKALVKCPGNSSKIVMAHNPASVKEFFVDAPHITEDIDFVISGHTHAGQFYVVIPIVYWLLPYFYGLYNVTQNLQLMVMAGSLYQGPPMKMIAMSEVWVIDFVASN